MKFNLMLLTAAAAAPALAHPRGMNMEGLLRSLAPHARRQATNTTVEMIGDLKTEGATTAVGTKIQQCLLGTGPCQDLSAKTYSPPGALGSSACAADTCCVWDSVASDLVTLFTDSTTGQCNKFARAAVRFGFHDAGAWSKTSGFGGADGSLLLSPDEVSRTENNGLQDIRIEGLKLLSKYAPFGVGGADLVQFMHNIAVVVCPLGPRQITFVGRDDAINDPTGLLPDTHSPAEVLIELFANKTFTVIDLISLIGAHTTATQQFVDPSKAGFPLDSTPGIWDVAFYGETLASTPPAGVFRLPSDDALAKNNETTRGFTVFSDPTTGQAAWNALYAKGYTRLSLLGVNKINELIDCTHVLPNAILTVPSSNTTSSSSSSSSATSSTSSSSSTSSANTTTSSYSISSASYSNYTTSTSAYPSSYYDYPDPTSSSTVSYTTSTVCKYETYTTADGTVTKTVTSTIPLYTTVVPCTETRSSTSSESTTTVYTTKTHTVTLSKSPVVTSSTSSTPVAPVIPSSVCVMSTTTTTVWI